MKLVKTSFKDYAGGFALQGFVEAKSKLSNVLCYLFNLVRVDIVE